MPTYQYHCKDCGNDLEKFQKFSEPSLTECPACGGHLNKVYNAVGVVFKGSGFYATDSRSAKSKGTKSGSGDAAKKSDSSSGSSGSESSGSSGSSDTKKTETKTNSSKKDAAAS